MSIRRRQLTFRSVPQVLTAVVLIAICGCAQFEQPLSPLDEAKPDQRIFGTWLREETNASGHTTRSYLHIGAASVIRPNDGDRNFPPEDRADEDSLPYRHLMRVVYVEIKPDGAVTGESWVGYPTPTGDGVYVNVPIFQKREVQSYFLWKYRLQGDELTIWLEVDPDVVKDFVAQGKLHGKVDGSLVTDSPAALREFLAREGDAAFFKDDDKGVYHRQTSAPRATPDN